MNIFKNKITLLINGCDQNASEKLIELATFFYKIDKRVSLAEQEYIDELLKTTEWNSSVSIESYQEKCISKINGILESSEDQILIYLSNLLQEISELGVTSKAKTLATEISDADGEIADDEIKYLDLVKSFD